MKAEAKQHREPFLRIAKRDGLVWWKAWLIRIAAVAAAACAGIYFLNQLGVFGR